MSVDRKAAQLLAAALAALDGLSERFGDNGARHAAALLRGRRVGRIATDDAAALAEIRRLKACGHGREAVGAVARQLASTEAAREAIARRLRRKLKSNGRIA